MSGIGTRPSVVGAAVLAAALSSGCRGVGGGGGAFVPPPVPKELNKANHPDYRVEPPDILVIEAVRTIPKPPYKAEPLDILFVGLANPLPNDPPLSGQVSVDPDGTIDLGQTYGGRLKVVGLTLPEIQKAVAGQVVTNTGIKKPDVSVQLAQGRGAQRIAGPHLVRPDGTVALGTYGSVRVSGMTLAEARRAIEEQLSNYLLDPEVAVDVQSYNSKLFYVILDGAGAGQTVLRLPITGNETVLDAISQAGGLTAASSPRRVWIARPAPEGAGCQILPVDWPSVVRKGDPATNYQILPGDRVFVDGFPATKADNVLARVIAPVERVFSIILLGNGLIQNLRFSNQGFNQGFNNGFNNGFNPGVNTGFNGNFIP